MVIDTFVRLATRLGRRRRIRPAGAPVKVNVGAGLEVAPGWIHVDGNLHALAANMPAPVASVVYRGTTHVRGSMSRADYLARLRQHQFVFHDLQFGLPFDDASVDFIFCSHVLEHFTRQDGLQLVHEMFRVLKGGGRIRLAVPDLAKAIETYNAGDREAALDYFFTDGRAGSLDQHRYMYDFTLMQRLLREAGFDDVVQCSFRSGQVPDLDRLDNRPEQSLFVEAVKP